MKAWLSLSRDELLQTSARAISDKLAAAQVRRFATVDHQQLMAWEQQAKCLQAAMSTLYAEGSRILFEYDLLRLDKRPDVVIVTPRAILVLEFKNGAEAYSHQDKRQADDYAQDLRDFHAACQSHPVVPVLVCTNAPDPGINIPAASADPFPLMLSNAGSLPRLLDALLKTVRGKAPPLDVDAWEGAEYRPVPTIIAAAELLYAKHGVDEIAAARSDTQNLTRTTEAILRAIEQTRAAGGRSVVFVTGIPGAGKTLCGLNIVFSGKTTAAFLSGNVPLIKVLREALASNAAARSGAAIDDERHTTHGFLQNVHRFLEEHVTSNSPPPDNVIVFDEAQRAWDAKQATKDTLRRKSHLTTSEPAHALEIMQRAKDFGVIVALVGQGQEINTGEAGLAEWGRAISASNGWTAFAGGSVLTAPVPEQRLEKAPWLTFDDDLDLRVPIRAVRSDAGSTWVEAVLSKNQPEAARIASAAGDLPYYMTRNLADLREGLRRFCRGQRRAGLVASSGAKRLRAEGLGVQVQGIENWFLAAWPDIRSSEALETFATEYDCQGLELDAVGLAWGGDLISQTTTWNYRNFAGARWNQVDVKNEKDRKFILNSYRVLLTRARYETIIWVPPGSKRDDPFFDATRDAQDMDRVADYLRSCGVRPLEV